jgi:hypothetical protein
LPLFRQIAQKINLLDCTNFNLDFCALWPITKIGNFWLPVLEVIYISKKW